MMPSPDRLAELTSPVVAAWFRGQLSPAGLQTARDNRSLDAVTYTTLARCGNPLSIGWAHYRDVYLLVGNGVLTRAVLVELVREGIVSRGFADSILPVLDALEAAGERIPRRVVATNGQLTLPFSLGGQEAN